MNLEEYFKGTDYLENREEKLFDIIDKIDKESFKIFNEVMDLDINSYYKVESLFKRINNLCKMISKLSECYEYLRNIEIESFSFAGKRLLLKRLITALVSAFALYCNIIMGMLSYFALSTLANNYYANEIGDITLRVDKYNKYDLDEITKTLKNCSDLLKRKINKYYLDNNISEDIKNINDILSSFLLSEISIEEITSFDDNKKLAILKVLQKDLESNSNNLTELLTTLKNKNDDELKLTKEITR